MSFHQDFQHRAVLSSSAKVVPKVNPIFRTPTITKRTPAFTSTDNTGYYDLSLFTGQGPRGSAPPTASWTNLKIGGGGFCTGLDIHNDGTMVTRVDVYGSYVGSTTIGTVWQQLQDSNKLPSIIANPASPYLDAFAGGCYEIRIAPSNSNIMYMAQCGAGGHALTRVIKSIDKGKTWNTTGWESTPGPVLADSNGSSSNCNQKLAIDPANANVVYAGTATNGIYRTVDGGATWTNLNSLVPASTTVSGAAMVFDTTSGTTGGKTNRLVVGSWGHGLYVSTDAGTTFTLIGSSPTTPRHGKMAADGTLWFTDDTTGFVYRYTTAGVFATILNDNFYATVICHPTDKDKVVADRFGAYFNYSLNATNSTPTWSGVNFNKITAATDVPWMTFIQDTFQSEGEMQWDPTNTNRIWLAMGTGVQYTDGLADPALSQQQVWLGQTIGIENMVATDCIWPAGNNPTVSFWDRPFFKIVDFAKYPGSYGPTPRDAGHIELGFSMDFPPSNPNFYVGLAGTVCFSTDGITWTRATDPPQDTGAIGGGGCITAFDTNKFLVARSNGFGIYLSTDQGATWNQPASLPTTGWGGTASNSRRSVCVDRVTAGTGYAYNSSTPGVYKSTDSGSTWTLVHTGLLSGDVGGLGMMKSVPGNAGHLVASFGGFLQVTGSIPDPTMTLDRSTNGGTTWTSVPNVLEVTAFGFGAAKPGGSGYPAVYISGWVSGVFGIWRSDDFNLATPTWTKLAAWPPRPDIDSGNGGWLDGVQALEGNPSKWNECIVGGQGSSFAHWG